MRIATFGDVLLDVVVLLEEPLAPGGDVRASNRAGAGGQAANVAAWAAELGAEARCIAKRGDDPAGEVVAGELTARGVELVGPVGAGATGVVVSVVGDGDRALASDRGVAPSFEPEELEAAWLACDVLHLSGYALLRRPIADAALEAARLAREQGARVSVDVAAWTEIRSYGPVQFRELLDVLAPDVLFATEAEWELLGGAYLAAPVGVLKRGARGCTVFTQEAKLDFAAVETAVVDPTGAGRRSRRRLPRGRLSRGGGATRARRGRPLHRESRVAAMKVEALTDEQAAEIAEWRYDFPYEWYDTSADPSRVELFANPARRTHLRAVVDEEGKLVGFFNFVPEGHEVRLGLGMRPDLTGRGLAQPFIAAGLDYAQREWQPRTFRLWVASWNERALRAYRRAGFHQVRHGEESRFVEMERSA